MNYKKIFSKVCNRETILYGVFGVLTSLLNVFLFKLLITVQIEYKIANLITLIVVKLAAYLCNKFFVFESINKNFLGFIKEFVRFVIARGATALIDYFGLILLVEAWNLDKTISKIFVTVFVIILNYILGKTAVFKDSKEKKNENKSETEI